MLMAENLLTMRRRRRASGPPSTPSWVQIAGGVAPVIDIDFLHDRAYVNGVETNVAAVMTGTPPYMDASGLTGRVTVTDTSPIAGATGLTTMAVGSGAVPQIGVNQCMAELSNTVGGALWYARQTNTSVTMFVRDAASSIQMNAAPSGVDNHSYRRKHLITMTTNAGFGALQDGTVQSDALCTLPAFNRIAIGGQFSSSLWGGAVHRFTVWNTALTSTQLQALSAAQNTLTILAEGDSITAGATGWPAQLRTVAPLDWYTHNVAVGGSSLNNSTPAANINSAARKATLDELRVRYATANPGRPVLTTILTGHNEVALDGNSAATFLAELETYCDERRAAGHTVVVVPPTPSTTAGVAAFRATVAAAVAGWVGTHADYVVDWTGVSGMADADASNTALWTDGIHPSAAQSLVMAQAMKTQVFDVVAAL